MTGQQISTAEDLDALPVNSYWQCRCEYHGMKGGRDRYVLSTGRILTAEQMVEDHLPLTVLYRPDAPGAPSDDSAVKPLPVENYGDFGRGWNAALAARGDTTPTISAEQVEAAERWLRESWGTSASGRHNFVATHARAITRNLLGALGIEVRS